MARKQVVEIVCDRCGKTEHVSDLKRLEKKNGAKDFVGHYLDPETSKPESIEFEDVCSNCRGVVDNAWKTLAHFKRKKDDPPETGPPVKE